ncbi:Lcl C-terminal domain-containing protein [Aeromonas molluscorum]|jgi:hypothetical protein|uniref:Lcl C-terminal domain-containing protein n=1 Tax=Aeromonas molluscorum 848 TaxID=1268236 RepID=R1F528_9GAMM|nr:DUF1566 domain-containing protein [Aeromonas molluscorum]EOD54953.1 hypothetical protein G113_11581 [Aeromonas molluscorum 848]
MKKQILTLLLTLGCTNAMAAAICDDNMPRTSPTSRFADHGDGTVTDRTTGLTWMRCQLGQTWQNQSCSGEPTRLYWQQALLTAERIRTESSHGLHGFGGHQDWRLPTIKELTSLLESACYKPALNETIFPRAMAGEGKEVNDGYVYLWSSTPFPADKSVAYMEITSGAVGMHAPRSGTKQLLLVR